MRINGHRALDTVIQQVGYINQLFPASASDSNLNISAVISGHISCSAPTIDEVSQRVVMGLSPFTISLLLLNSLDLRMTCKWPLIPIVVCSEGSQHQPVLRTIADYSSK